MQSQTCPATELHSSLQNFRASSLRGAQPSSFSLNFSATKEEELQEHLKLPQISTERGQTTQFTDFYFNLHINTADCSPSLVVTITPLIFLLYSLFTNWALVLRDLAREGTQVQQPELFHPGLELENQNQPNSDHNKQKYFIYL